MESRPLRATDKHVRVFHSITDPGFFGFPALQTCDTNEHVRHLLFKFFLPRSVRTVRLFCKRTANLLPSRNWSTTIFGGILVIASVFYVFKARHLYVGPVMLVKRTVVQ
jgi:hypothetical protein